MSICGDLYQSNHHGALRWTAPELINGDEDQVSYNSDIYSFGCVAIHVCCPSVSSCSTLPMPSRFYLESYHTGG